jgi:hypothetical protein
MVQKKTFPNFPWIKKTYESIAIHMITPVLEEVLLSQQKNKIQHQRMR